MGLSPCTPPVLSHTCGDRAAVCMSACEEHARWIKLLLLQMASLQPLACKDLSTWGAIKTCICITTVRCAAAVLQLRSLTSSLST
jgi:hypothetical protein